MHCLSVKCKMTFEKFYRNVRHKPCYLEQSTLSGKACICLFFLNVDSQCFKQNFTHLHYGEVAASLAGVSKPQQTQPELSAWLDDTWKRWENMFICDLGELTWVAAFTVHLYSNESIVWHIKPSATCCQCVRKTRLSLGEHTALNRRLLVVTHRLCRPGYVDWRVQRRALSTTPLKIVHKYCRVTLCLSAALNLPSLTRQLCFGNVLPSRTQHTPWQAPYILMYCC